MLKSISSPPTDTFTANLFYQLVNDLQVPHAAYYIWSSPANKFIEFMSTTNFDTHSNVIIGIKDLLDCWQEYNYWKQTCQVGSKLIQATAQQWPKTNFVICTSVENLSQELDEPNIQIVPWGGDCVNQHCEYQSLQPVLDKNFASQRHYITLNRNSREHRVVLLSYLFGSGLSQFGQISYLSNESQFNTLLDRINWEFEPHHDQFKQTLLKGFDQFKNSTIGTDKHEEVYSTTNNNVYNFNYNLRNKYRNSFLEIVTESSFPSPSFMITEKTMHSFYACNFPIILAGSGAVQHLRDVGFDMFDDVINHSYDVIANPIDRIITAIDSNYHLLTDAILVKQLWVENRPRFIKNVNTANDITMYYEHRTKSIWNNLCWTK